MVSGANDHREGLRLRELTITAARTNLDAVGARRTEDPVAVHVGRLGRVYDAVALCRVEVDLRARTEGASLEECYSRALGGLRQMQGQVSALGQGSVVDALGG